MSSTQDEVSEEEASPIVVFAVFSELVITAQNLPQASMASKIIRVDVGGQKLVLV